MGAPSFPKAPLARMELAVVLEVFCRLVANAQRIDHESMREEPGSTHAAVTTGLRLRLWPV